MIQELWRRVIDNDAVYGPWGHRGHKRKSGEEIFDGFFTFTTNSTLDAEFRNHAVSKLGLEAFS